MDELDIFAAIGGVDEDLLGDKPRRLLPKRWGLIAAVLALAVLTACAAPVVLRSFTVVSSGEAELTRGAYRTGSVVIDRETGDIVGFNGSGERYPAEYEIRLEIEEAGRRPETLEERYALTWVPENYGKYFDNSEEETVVWRFCSEDSPDQRLRYVEFRQSLLPEGNPVIFTDSFSAFRDMFVNRMDSRTVTYGEATVLELYPCITEEEMEIAETIFFQTSRYLYWSDGAYLFRLEIPCEMDTQDVARIIESIQVQDPEA